MGAEGQGRHREVKKATAQKCHWCIMNKCVSSSNFTVYMKGRGVSYSEWAKDLNRDWLC